jgi:hypothetical protein
MLIIKKFNGEEIEVEGVSEIRLGDIVIEAGGWGAGLRVTLPPSMTTVSVSSLNDGCLVVRLGY